MWNDREWKADSPHCLSYIEGHAGVSMPSCIGERWLMRIPINSNPVNGIISTADLSLTICSDTEEGNEDPISS